MASRRPPRRPTLNRSRIALVGVTVIGVAALLVITGGGDDDASPAARDADPGANLLDIELSDLDGAPVRLEALVAGKPSVVNFFASWCGPCVREMPDFEAVHSRRGDDVQFVGINLQDSPAAARELIEQTGVTYDVAQDDRGELFRAMGAVSMPTTVFLDAAGAIVDIHGGELSRRDLDARIDRLLGR